MEELWKRVEIKRVIATNGIKAMLSILNNTPIMSWQNSQILG